MRVGMMLWGLAGLAAVVPAGAAEPVKEACDTVVRQLRGTPSDRFDVGPAEGGGPGCHITLESSWAKIRNNRQHPDRLLSVDEDAALGRSGWGRDSSEDADGPDGTSYTLIRGEARCRVTGSWDGGDDSDRRPSDRFTYVVNCGLR